MMDCPFRDENTGQCNYHTGPTYCDPTDAKCGMPDKTVRYFNSDCKGCKYLVRVWARGNIDKCKKCRRHYQHLDDLYKELKH